MNDRLKRVDELPKIDLHHHLDGAIRTSTIFELGQKQGIDLPADDPDSLAEWVTVGDQCQGLSDFLNCFEVFYPVLQTESALQRVAFELCEDVANQNIAYMETRFAPVLMTEGQLNLKQVVEAVLDGLEDGRREFDVDIRLILCTYRGTPPEASKQTVNLAEKYEDRHVVGIDIAGDESQYSAKPHQEAFEMAREAGLSITAHAGEAAGPENIRQALELGAQRIGHGVAVAESPDLLAEIVEREIPLEICLTSNLHTEVVESIDAHPFIEFYQRGVPVTLNTDDPAISRIDINHEFRLAFLETCLTIDDLKMLLLHSVSASFADKSTRQRLRKLIKQA